MKRENEIDATVTIEEHNERALVPITEIRRHPLLAKKKKKYVREVKKELDLDAKLGLNIQSEETAKKALTKDIDELTNSRDYCEISKKGLERLFGIQWLNFFYCLPYNLAQKLNVAYQVLLGTVRCKLLATATFFLIPLSLFCYAMVTWTTTTRWHTLFNTSIIIVIAITAVCLVTWAMSAFNFDLESPEPQIEPEPDEEGVTRYTLRNEESNDEQILREKREKNGRRVITFSKIGVSLKLVPVNEARGFKLTQ